MGIRLCVRNLNKTNGQHCCRTDVFEHVSHDVHVDLGLQTVGRVLEQQLDVLAAVARPDVVVIVDDAFLHFLAHILVFHVTLQAAQCGT